MKVYIISGLGADDKVLEKLEFNKAIEPIFIHWKIPQRGEHFHHYVERMAEEIDESEPFGLLGYSFGGIMVQEINQIKPAVKTVILGSIKSDKEKSKLIRAGEITHIPRYLPESLFNEKSTVAYAFLRKLFDPKPDYVIPGGTHLFPATKHRQVSEILKEIFK